MKENNIGHTLTTDEIRFLKRLPSVRLRNIDLEQTLQKNKVVVLRDSKNSFLQCIFYHIFDDFVYMHTTIGRDEFKLETFQRLFEITTEFGPSLCVFFDSPASVKAMLKLGGKEIKNDVSEALDAYKLIKINKLTNSDFYIRDGILFDRKDKVQIKNPLYLITKESFKPIIKSNEIASISRLDLTTGYNKRFLDNKEISLFYKMLVNPLLGEDIISISNFSLMHETNSTIATIVEKQEMSAFYCLFPISGTLFNEFIDGTKNALSIQPEDVCLKESDYAYFAGGGGNNLRDRAAGIVFFAQDVTKFKKVLTKPVTKEGLSFIQRIGFAPINESLNSQIGVLHILDTTA